MRPLQVGHLHVWPYSFARLEQREGGGWWERGFSGVGLISQTLQISRLGVCDKEAWGILRRLRLEDFQVEGEIIAHGSWLMAHVGCGGRREGENEVRNWSRTRNGGCSSNKRDAEDED